MLFREKAFWTFSRGQRLGDLRRLIRDYGRNEANTFPRGQHYRGGPYGVDVNMPVPTDELNNPNKTFRRGVQGNDVPFSLRLSGLYELPLGIQASGTFQRQSGFPELNIVSVGNNTFALTQGTTTVAVDPRATTRLPTLNQLDASFRKAFRSHGRAILPRLDFYNMLNSATITSRVTTLGGSYQLPNSIQRGRIIKLGLNVEY